METAQDFSAHTAPAPAADAGPKWGFFKRLGFRFAFVYWLLYSFPFPLDGLPYMEKAGEWYTALWDRIVLWVGGSILHVPYAISTADTGSGDRTYDYVRLFCILVLAVTATIVWSAADAKRGHYTRQYEALRVYVRYVLGAAMISYGLFKVIKTQFPYPPLDWMTQTYGDSSPMRLVWFFMGFSEPYTVFAGAGEMLAGLLLFFRRTTTLGALVTIAVMSNVVAMNFSYDIPVKLYSSHLLLMALFLLIPDLKRLLSIFLLNRPTEPAKIAPHFKNALLNIPAMLVKFAFIGYMLYGGITESLKFQSERQNMPKPPLYGYYQVEEFVRDGQAVPLLVTDEKLWKKLIVNEYGMIAVRFMNDSSDRMMCEFDATKRTVTVNPRWDVENKYTLNYAEPDKDHVVLEGKLGEEQLKVTLKRLPIDSFALSARGFHWINEVPNNR